MVDVGGAPLLVGNSFPQQMPFKMVGRVTFSEMRADGQIEIGDVGVAPHLPLMERGNLQRSSVSQLRNMPMAVVGPRAAVAWSW